MSIDSSDEALRNRLVRLLDAVPVEAPPAPTLASPRVSAGPRVALRTAPGLGLTLVIAAVVVAVLAFGRPPSSGGPLTGVATDGPFKLTISVPRGTYAAGEPITGITASLEYTGRSGGVSIKHSAGGPIGFAVSSVDGLHRVEPGWDQVCQGSELSAGHPMTATYAESGGYWPEESDYPWLSSFFATQALTLEPGQWTITAVADFDELTCGGTAHDIRAPVTIDVRGAPGPRPTPSLTIPASATNTLLTAFQAEGFVFQYPSDWRVVDGYDHVGLHGPTIQAAVGIGAFDLGCSSTSTSVSCPADPRWTVPDDGVVLVYRFGAWLGMCSPLAADPGPAGQMVSVDGRTALKTMTDRSITWKFPGAPEYIEARWGAANPHAREQVEQVVASWRWAPNHPGCNDQPSSAPS